MIITLIKPFDYENLSVLSHLFLILVLTRGASNLGLVPTSTTRSASYSMKDVEGGMSVTINLIE